MIFQFGTITNPFKQLSPGSPLANLGADQSSGQGLFLILNNLVRFSIILASLYTFWNLIAAGYGFMSAGGEAKAIEKAWAKIWQSLLGLLIAAASFVLAMVFGKLIFNDPSILISPQIFAPGEATP